MRDSTASTSIAGAAAGAVPMAWKSATCTTAVTGSMDGSDGMAASRLSARSSCGLESCCLGALSTMQSLTSSGCTRRRAMKAFPWNALTVGRPS